MFETIDATELRRRLDGACPPRIVDVRTAPEVARGTITGATHIELSTLPARHPELDRDSPVVFICQSGARSGQACAYLAQRGFTHACNLAGGIAGWMSAGMPLSELDR
ncbi:MAG TPA: rhodanese-like domain-containing protein [Casimicrobiaceae bacterium]|jgi:rhodanese-related sulfurtransferase